MTIPVDAYDGIKLADWSKYRKYTMEKLVFPKETTTKKPSSSSSGTRKRVKVKCTSCRPACHWKD